VMFFDGGFEAQMSQDFFKGGFGICWHNLWFYRFFF